MTWPICFSRRLGQRAGGAESVGDPRGSGRWAVNSHGGPGRCWCYYEARAPQSTEQARPIGCFNPREASEDFTEEGVYRIRYLTQGIPNVLRHGGGFMRLGDDEVEGERKNEESG